VSQIATLQRKRVPVTLRDDEGNQVDLVLSGLSLDAYEMFTAFQEGRSDMDKMLDVLLAALGPRHPDITREELRAHLTLDMLAPLGDAIQQLVPQEEKGTMQCPQCGHRFPFDLRTSSAPSPEKPSNNGA
jgi:hypothetical protein